MTDRFTFAHVAREEELWDHFKSQAKKNLVAGVTFSGSLFLPHLSECPIVNHFLLFLLFRVGRPCLPFL
eukprot:758882-Hanusia_phi.AAC.5